MLGNEAHTNGSAGYAARISLAVAAASLVLALSSCEVLGDIVSKPTARVDSVEISKVDFSGVALNVNVEIDNPNPFGLTLNAYDYGLSVEGKDVVKGRNEEGASIAAGGRSVLPIPVELGFEDLAAVVPSLLEDDTIPVAAALGLEIDVPYVGGVRLDVSGSAGIPVVKPPVILPKRLRVESIGLTGASAVLTADIRNPNGYGLDVRGVTGDLSVAGRGWGGVGVDRPVSVSPRGAEPIEFRLNLDFGEIGRSAWSLLTGSSKLDVSLDGSMDARLDLPGFTPGNLDWDADADVSIVR